LKQDESSPSDAPCHHESGAAARHGARTEDGEALSWPQAYEAAYRFLVRYYRHERVVPILRLVESISAEQSGSGRGAWTTWEACVRETLTGAPFPTVPPPWD
jgi:hypothetical protein